MYGIGPHKPRESKTFFFDTHAIGHETADIQVSKLLATVDDSLHPGRLIQLSRDGPNVNKSTVKKLREELKQMGNPGQIEIGSCVLHPAHTSFRKGLDSLESDVSGFSQCLFSFFRHSTARREDFSKVSEMMSLEEEISRFYVRPVDTRWLTMQSVLDRILENWDAAIIFFTEYIPKSRDASAKQAQKTQTFKIINEFLKPRNVGNNYIRVRFLSYICQLFEPFMTSLQSEKPMIHLLHEKMTNLLSSLLSLIVQSELIPEDGKRLSEVKVRELDPTTLFVPPSLRTRFATLDGQSERRMKKELHACVVCIFEYLTDHLPLTNDVVVKAQCLNPLDRKKGESKDRVLGLARRTHRFTPPELDLIGIQWQFYQTKSFEAITYSRIEEYWNGIFKQYEKFDLDHPVELERLVRMILTLSHGQADVERGFSITKALVQSRERISNKTLKGQKIVHGFISKYGGSEKVPITRSVIISMRKAHSEYRKELEETARENERSKREKHELEEQSRKRKAAEEESLSKESKKKKLEQEIKSTNESLSTQKALRESAMSAVKSSQDKALMKVSIATVDAATKEIDILTQSLIEMSTKLATLK